MNLILLAEVMIRRGCALLVSGAVLLTLAAGCGEPSSTAEQPGSATWSSAPSLLDAGVPDQASRSAWLDRGGCHEVADDSATFSTQSTDAAAPLATASTTVAGPAISTTSKAGISNTVDVTDEGAVLTISGLSIAGSVTITMSALDAMSQVECTVNDRQGVGRDVVFSGVLVTDLLTAIGGVNATTLHTTALNDYAVDIPMSDVDAVPVLLATRADDQLMSVANYGPLRFIYPTTGYDLDPTIYDPRWIWQLSTIELK